MDLYQVSYEAGHRIAVHKDLPFYPGIPPELIPKLQINAEGLHFSALVICLCDLYRILL